MRGIARYGNTVTELLGGAVKNGDTATDVLRGAAKHADTAAQWGVLAAAVRKADDSGEALKSADEALDAARNAAKSSDELIEGAGNLSGPVEITPPLNATSEQIAQTKAYIDGSNQALQSGKLSPTGRVSTAGSLRIRASASAAAERARAATAGTPYQGHVGHVPDTTWTGTADPFSWLDLDSSVNMSIGGQANRYPIGYKPTEFRFRDR